MRCKTLGDETDRVNKLWSELTIQLQALSANRAIVRLLESYRRLAAGTGAVQRLNALRKDFGWHGSW